MKTSSRTIDSATVLPRALRTRAGWSRLFDMKRARQPHLHQIEPTNHCIYSCVMCPRRKMTRDVGFMEFDLFKKVIDEVACFEEPTRSRDIELFHFGESLFHPQLDSMIALAADRQLNTVLSVNAPQLVADVARRLLESRVSRIIISLDGKNQETYMQARGPAADYSAASRNIEELIRLRDQLHPGTRLVVRMILMHSHEVMAPEFEETWRARGVDVELREFFPWGEPEMAALGDYRRYPPGMPCPFPWQYSVVQWNGDVVPCCRDYNAVNVMGNVRDTSLEEIWNSERYEAFRQQHRTGNYGDNQTCIKCMGLYYTEEEHG